MRTYRSAAVYTGCRNARPKLALAYAAERNSRDRYDGGGDQGGEGRGRQGSEWGDFFSIFFSSFGSIAQQQRTMIHLAPLSRALIGIRRRIGGSWSVVFGLGIAVRPLVLGMRAISVHNDQTASYSRAIRISGSHWAVRVSLDR